MVTRVRFPLSFPIYSETPYLEALWKQEGENCFEIMRVAVGAESKLPPEKNRENGSFY
jgi:hypothetical protein